MMMRLVLGLTTIVAVVALAFGAGHDRNIAQANPVGTTAAPLLSCPTVSGGGTVDLFNDIFGVAFKFGATPGDGSYALIYDVGFADGEIDLFNDIFGVALRFGEVCPLIDQQIAQATQAILNDPQAAQLLACNPTTLNGRGYFRAGSDVPGQGVHYIKAPWDGVFDVTQPEGMVCQGGKLAAELYVVNGYMVGWGPFTPGGGSAMHGVNIDTFCTMTPCSWAGPETWHAHSNLCLYHIGTPSSAITVTADAAACTALNGGIGISVWAAGVGWMGHLWNFVPNENQLPDVDDTTNGRFADCRPPFKAEGCPM